MKSHKNAVTVVGANIISHKQATFFMLVMFVLSLFLMPLQAMAAIDVTAALTTFGEVNTAIPTVGAAFLLALGILAAWKLIRGAFA